MRQVLCISSSVAYGTVGLAASVPALQAAGFTSLQLPTIILSNHPGLGKPAGVRLPATEIAAMLTVLEQQQVLASCTGVLTGYFASADQVAAAATIIAHMKQQQPGLFVLVDPVLGDSGKLYVAEDVAIAVRDLLLPLASCATPNRFELGWLTGRDISSRTEAEAAARALPCAETLATSIVGGADELLTLMVTANETSVHAAPLRTHVPHGTGDFLSGLYLAARLNGFDPANALQISSALLDEAITRSVGQATLDVIGTLQGT
jgi:pyridoxine kinase